MLQANAISVRRGGRMVLDDITVAVQPGSLVAVVGPNGAGKSTLLRLAGGVGRADEGRVTVNGRIGALLDLGAGFHPDLTGRENVYINGVIAGLTHRQVDDRFADIVHEYDMLPVIFVNAFSLMMPAVELTAGAVLVLGVWRRAAGLLATALCAAFMVAIAQAEIRGLEVECGCFDVSGMSATHATWDLFVRDLGLLAASALMWRRG